MKWGKWAIWKDYYRIIFIFLLTLKIISTFCSYIILKFSGKYYSKSSSFWVILLASHLRYVIITVGVTQPFCECVINSSEFSFSYFFWHLTVFPLATRDKGIFTFGFIQIVPMKVVPSFTFKLSFVARIDSFPFWPNYSIW